MSDDDEVVAYGECDYWNSRYQKPVYQDYEWYLSYQAIKEHKGFDGVFLNGAATRILQVGCGNSALWLELYKDGYRNQINIDVSKVVVAQMQSKYASYIDGNLQFLEMDACDMSQFTDESFDLVFEKGTLDAVACSHNSYTNLYLMLKEICRVLKVGGHLISATFASEDMRLRHLIRREFPWQVQVTAVRVESRFDDTTNALSYFIYRARKQQPYHVPPAPLEDLLVSELRESSPSYREVEEDLDALHLASSSSTTPSSSPSSSSASEPAKT